MSEEEKDYIRILEELKDKYSGFVISKKEAAHYLGIHSSTLTRMVKRGELALKIDIKPKRGQKTYISLFDFAKVLSIYKVK